MMRVGETHLYAFLTTHVARSMLVPRMRRYDFATSRDCGELLPEREPLLALTRLYIRGIEERQREIRRDRGIANRIIAPLMVAALSLGALLFLMRL